VTRGELYLVRKPGAQDSRKQRVFVVVSGLSTQLRVRTTEGLKKESSIHGDELVSLPKPVLTHDIGSLKPARAVFFFWVPIIAMVGSRGKV
jgi:hypothetical protein